MLNISSILRYLLDMTIHIIDTLSSQLQVLHVYAGNLKESIYVIKNDYGICIDLWWSQI